MTNASHAATTEATVPKSTIVGGAKVTINPDATPSEQLVAAAVNRVVVRDERGREIVLAKPKVLDQFRLIEALGDSARNEVYMGMVLPLLFVSKVDDDVIARPARKGELEALIQQLDDDGIQAVLEGVAANFGMHTEDEAKNA